MFQLFTSLRICRAVHGISLCMFILYCPLLSCAKYIFNQSSILQNVPPKSIMLTLHFVRKCKWRMWFDVYYLITYLNIVSWYVSQSVVELLNHLLLQLPTDFCQVVATMLDIKLVRPTIVETSTLVFGQRLEWRAQWTPLCSPWTWCLMARLKNINQWLALVLRRFRELLEGGNMCGGFMVIVWKMEILVEQIQGERHCERHATGKDDVI